MSQDDGIQVEVSADIVALTRVNIIGYVARDVVAATGAPASMLEMVLDGFRESLLRRVQLLLRDSSNNIVGYLKIEVDWERFSLNLSTGSSKSMFKIDRRLPISGQIAPLLDKAVAYIARVTKDLKVTRWDPTYTAREGKYAEFKKRFNTRPLTPEEEAELRSASLDNELEVTDHELSEMQVSFRFRKT